MPKTIQLQCLFVMDSDDKDIFCYTPLIRNRSLSQASEREKEKPARLNQSQQVVSKSNLKRRKRPEPAQFICPICQMPWMSIGMRGKRTVHTNKCAAVDYSRKKVCPKGIACQEYCEYHYLNYGHHVLAEARAEEMNVSGTSNRRSPNGDSGYEDGAVAVPSGWKPSLFKLENSDLTLLSSKENSYSSSQSNELGTNKRTQSVKLFDLCEDEESLPNLEKIFSSTKDKFVPQEVPDLDLTAISHVRDDKVTDDDQKTLIFPPASTHSLSPHDGDQDDIERVYGSNLNDFESEHSNHSSATEMYDEVARGVGNDATAPVPNRKDNSDTDIDLYFSEESRSLLSNQEQTPDVADKGKGSPKQTEFDKPIDDNLSVNDDNELNADDYEVINKMVDEAIDKYVGKGIINSKCFHLHLHYNENQQISPHKDGQKSILNYFKPVNAKTPSKNESGSSSSHCCQCGSSGQGKAEDKKAGGQD